MHSKDSQNINFESFDPNQANVELDKIVTEDESREIGTDNSLSKDIHETNENKEINIIDKDKATKKETAMSFLNNLGKLKKMEVDENKLDPRMKLDTNEDIKDNRVDASELVVKQRPPKKTYPREGLVKALTKVEDRKINNSVWNADITKDDCEYTIVLT